MRPLLASSGFRVGKYELRRAIGSGATSVVYEATDSTSSRRVAVKLLQGGFDPPFGAAARFLREVRAASDVRHPNIVEILDCGEAEGTAFLVMELLAGDTLAGLLRETGKLPLDRALALLLPILSAVEALHAAGIVHRDVKPANILLADGTRETAKLSDFGVSLQRGEVATLTRSHDVLGTPAYMAPELILFGASASSASSDQFALGVTFYESVTGRRPFARDSTFRTMQAVVAGHVPRPSLVEPSLPEALDEPILRAMRLNPGQRFASVAEFTAALHEIFDEVRRKSRASAPPPSAERTSTMPPRPSGVTRRARVSSAPRLEQCATRRIEVAGLDVIVWLHTQSEPPADAWARGCAVSVDAVRTGRGLPYARIFVVSDGGAPNVTQRKELFHDIFGGKPIKTSVITTTGTNPIKKGIATAISWFNPQIRLFDPTDLEGALGHVDIPRQAFAPVWECLVSMHLSVRTETLPMLARVLGLSLGD